MKVKYQKRFLKELAKVPSRTRTKIEKFVFEDVPGMNSLDESGKAEQMRGYPSFYKVRFGSYRLGIQIENDTIVFQRILHRKDIYRYFP